MSCDTRGLSNLRLAKFLLQTPNKFNDGFASGGHRASDQAGPAPPMSGRIDCIMDAFRSGRFLRFINVIDYRLTRR